MLGLINNPTKFLGNIVAPYCIIVDDSAGTQFLNGDMSAIFGYTYPEDNYGAQLLIKFSGRIEFRAKSDDVWSDFMNIK